VQWEEGEVVQEVRGGVATFLHLSVGTREHLGGLEVQGWTTWRHLRRGVDLQDWRGTLAHLLISLVTGTSSHSSLGTSTQFLHTSPTLSHSECRRVLQFLTNFVAIMIVQSSSYLVVQESLNFL